MKKEEQELIKKILEGEPVSDKVKVNLFDLLDDEIFSKSYPRSLKEKILYDYIDRLDDIPPRAYMLLGNMGFTLELAKKNVHAFSIVLMHIQNSLLEEVFKKYYENTYVYNEEDVIGYALNSPISLLLYLKSVPRSINKFTRIAYNDEVINYIIENKMFYLSNMTLLTNSNFVIAFLKEDIDNFRYLTIYSFTDEVIDYLKSINYIPKEEYMKKVANIIPPAFIVYLLEINIKNVEYITTHLSIDDKVIACLISKNYVYQSGDYVGLLDYPEIIKNTLINKNDDSILRMDIALSIECENIIVDNIIDNNLEVGIITNSLLMKNERLIKYFEDKYKNEPNPYNLPLFKRITSAYRGLTDEFVKYFSKEVTDILVDQVILNDYYLDLAGMFKVISVKKYKEIYDWLFRSERKIIRTFDFYFFIKVADFFQDNLELLKELNDCEINDLIISNLSIAIYLKDKNLHLNDILHYDKLYKNKVSKTDLTDKDKICLYLTAGDALDVWNLSDAFLFLDDLIYLQTFYDEGSIESRYIDGCITFFITLKRLCDCEDERTLRKFREILSKNYDTLRPEYRYDTIIDNLKDLYAKSFVRNKLDREKLAKEGRVETIDGVKIYHLEGVDFTLFSHRLDFNKNNKVAIQPFNSLFKDKELRDEQYANYVCTTYESCFSPYSMSLTDTALYEIDDDTNMIAFGNEDIFISHTERPLFTANSTYQNRFDLSYFFFDNGMTPTEVDFLRKKSDGSIKKPSFIVCGSDEDMPNCLKIAKENDIGIVRFDYDLNEQLLQETLGILRNNIENLDLDEMYKLIRLSVMKKSNKLNVDEINTILKTIKKYNNKIQYLIISKLKRYGYSDYELDFTYDNKIIISHR